MRYIKTLKITTLIIFCIILHSANIYAEEHVLRVLTWEGYLPSQVVKQFEKIISEKYGKKITIEVSQSEGSAEFYSPIRSHQTDVVLMTHNDFNDERFNYIKNGLLLPLDTKHFPRYETILPKLKTIKSVIDEGKIFGIPMAHGVYSIIYNKDKLEERPTSWKVFWKEEHKNKYALAKNEHICNAASVALAMGYDENDLTDFSKLNNEEFKEKLHAFAANASNFWESVDKANDILGKNIATSWGDSITEARFFAEEWAFAFPEEGSLIWVDCVALTNTLKEKPFLKEIALEFINFLLSKRYQIDYILRDRTNVPVTKDIYPLLTNQEREDTEKMHKYINDKGILLPTCSLKNRNGITLLWEEALTKHTQKKA